MRVLVTGASGFVGSFVAEQLVAQGQQIRLLLRRTSSTEFLADLDYERAEGDIRDPASLAAAMQGIEAVVHCAGLTSSLDEAAYIAANDRGTANVVDAALNAGVQHFVYVSSLGAQGPSLDGRMPDPQTVTPAPISAYGRSKLSGENHVLAAKDKMRVAIVRPPSVYGPRDRDFLIAFRAIGKWRLMAFYGDGLNQASWVNVHDCASAIVAATLRQPATGSIYTIADGPPHTWRDLVDSLARAVDKQPLKFYVPPLVYKAAGVAGGLASKYLHIDAPINPERAHQFNYRHWICDNQRITADLGWQPQYDCDAGVALTLGWYREHRWL